MLIVKKHECEFHSYLRENQMMQKKKKKKVAQNLINLLYAL